MRYESVPSLRGAKRRGNPGKIHIIEAKLFRAPVQTGSRPAGTLPVLAGSARRVPLRPPVWNIYRGEFCTLIKR